MKKRKKKTRIAALLGLGFDHHDGHKRITTGEKFAIFGGSEETHERMTETVVKTFEELKQKPKSPISPPRISKTRSGPPRRPSWSISGHPGAARAR
jgi:hypothetical protein